MNLNVEHGRPGVEAAAKSQSGTRAYRPSPTVVSARPAFDQKAIHRKAKRVLLPDALVPVPSNLE
jgi:hypothetical protein